MFLFLGCFGILSYTWKATLICNKYIMKTNNLCCLEMVFNFLLLLFLYVF